MRLPKPVEQRQLSIGKTSLWRENGNRALEGAISRAAASALYEVEGHKARPVVGDQGVQILCSRGSRSETEYLTLPGLAEALKVAAA